MKKWTSILLIALISGCDQTNKSDEDQGEEVELSKPVMASTNYPLQFFVSEIGGDHVQAIFPVKGDIDPAFNEPSAEEIKQFQDADIIFINGAGYEGWIEKVSLPNRKIINTSSSFANEYIESEGVSHSHGPEGDHSHTEIAFTTWLDLNNAVAQSKIVLDKLITVQPENKSQFQENFVRLTDALKQLDYGLREKIDSIESRNLYASHPVYQYLAQGYGLEVVSFHWEPGENPSEEQWDEFVDIHKEIQSVRMLWEDEPLPEVRARLEELGIKVVVFRPMGNIPETGDFLSNMEMNIGNF